MAKLNIASTSYSGELALPFVAPAILAANSIAQRYVSLFEEVKRRQVVKLLTGGQIVPAACDFDESVGTLNLAERVLETTDLMVNEWLCKNDLRSDWLSRELGPSFNGQDLPEAVEEQILLYLGRIVARYNERHIWQGNYNPEDGTDVGAPFTGYDGLLRHIVDSGSSNIDTITGPLTGDGTGNRIIEQLEALLALAPSDVHNDDANLIFMSKKSLFLLQREMSGVVTTSGGVSPTFVGDPRPSLFLGFQIVTPSGFPNDALLITKPENLAFGTDLMSDEISATVVDMQQTNASKNVRMAMHFSGGTQFMSADSLALIHREA